jgi:hypothetical protein
LSTFSCKLNSASVQGGTPDSVESEGKVVSAPRQRISPGMSPFPRKRTRAKQSSFAASTGALRIIWLRGVGEIAASSATRSVKRFETEDGRPQRTYRGQIRPPPKDEKLQLSVEVRTRGRHGDVQLSCTVNDIVDPAGISHPVAWVGFGPTDVSKPGQMV